MSLLHNTCKDISTVEFVKEYVIEKETNSKSLNISISMKNMQISQ